MELLVKITTRTPEDAGVGGINTPTEVAESVEQGILISNILISDVEMIAGGDKVIACDQEHFDRVIQAANDRAGGLLSFSKRMTGRASERASAASEAGAIINSIEEVKSL